MRNTHIQEERNTFYCTCSIYPVAILISDDKITTLNITFLLTQHSSTTESRHCYPTFSRLLAWSVQQYDHVYLPNLVLPRFNWRGRERWLWQRGNRWIQPENTAELLLYHLSLSGHKVMVDICCLTSSVFPNRWCWCSLSGSAASIFL